MKATQELMEEHEVILRVISAMETAVAAVPGGKTSPAFFLQAADFFKGFADGCHHIKEEKVLFPKMEESGVPAQAGPIGMMLTEHEQGRVYVREMRVAAEKWQAGDASAASQAAVSAERYAELLKAHIYKENNILFPMADRAIPEDGQEAVWEGFEKVEHEETGSNVHEKYLALAQKLEEQSRAF